MAVTPMSKAADHQDYKQKINYSDKTTSKHCRYLVDIKF